jgi:type IV secretory pathway VirJ component
MSMIKYIAILILFSGLKANTSAIEIMNYGSFGEITIYKPTKTPDAVVIFVSGDGGWNKQVDEMAKNILNQGALVIGIDIKRYLKSIKSSKSGCHYPAGDFEEMSLTIQKKYKLKQYLKPILVGYSSGATMAYGILAQSPENTFKGAISIGFSPDMEIDKPLCFGSGLNSHALTANKLYYFESCKQLPAPFIVLQGMTDKVCSYADTKKYMESMPLAEFVSLPNVGHGFSATKNWFPQFISAYQKIVKEADYIEKKAAQNKLFQSQKTTPLNTDLPLALIPSASKEKSLVALFISGDGGWTSFDHAICEKMAEKGIPVVGIDAQKYFWNEKKPKEAAADFENAITHYMKQWDRDSIILIGYSFGASVVPFIANNFSKPKRELIKGVYCISPDISCDFEIHIADMLDLGSREKYDVLHELNSIESLNPICIFGNDEDVELKNRFISAHIKIKTLPGNHHYDNDYNALAEAIIKNLKVKPN